MIINDEEIQSLLEIFDEKLKQIEFLLDYNFSRQLSHFQEKSEDNLRKLIFLKPIFKFFP